MKTRLAIIAFFVGVNLILGFYFLLTIKGQSMVPTPVREFFTTQGLLSKNKENVPSDSVPDYSLRIDLDSDDVISAINDHRTENNEDVLSSSNNLHVAAENVLEEIKAKNFELEEKDGNGWLETALKESKYYYTSAYQSIVIGPVTSTAVLEYWIHNGDKTILASDVSDIGVATIVVPIDGEFTGITVVIVAEPRGVTAVLPTQTPQAVKPALPQVSDQEVIDALNNYRKAHGLYSLNVNDNLCSYAQKRVGDLVANGGLDNHKGFRDDFADPEKRPEALKEYSSSKIGENLAHQFCRNMTTGDSFVAETGTALIEWCFDSSTKGHREAQLSTEFKNVCVRHADGMYVVIFSD